MALEGRGSFFRLEESRRRKVASHRGKWITQKEWRWKRPEGFPSTNGQEWHWKRVIPMAMQGMALEGCSLARVRPRPSFVGRHEKRNGVGRDALGDIAERNGVGSYWCELKTRPFAEKE
jgi:hypothetical protein